VLVHLSEVAVESGQTGGQELGFGGTAIEPLGPRYPTAGGIIVPFMYGGTGTGQSDALSSSRYPEQDRCQNEHNEQAAQDPLLGCPRLLSGVNLRSGTPAHVDPLTDSFYILAAGHTSLCACTAADRERMEGELTANGRE
jgi:hypothetical protein